MKRDMELIKNIMLEIEAGTFKNLIEDYEEQQVLYHVKLLLDAKLISGKYYNDKLSKEYGVILSPSLTWQGHDFIDILRDDSKFKVLKDLGKNLSLDTIKTGINQIIQNAMT